MRKIFATFAVNGFDFYQLIHFNMIPIVKKLLFCSLGCAVFVTANAQIPAGYKGKPFKDKFYTAGPQVIPGRVELAYYDLGGEGVGYHDTTPTNDGSVLNHTEGHWRPGIPEYIVFFRENEGVDISYTKDWADFNHPNKVDPKGIITVYGYQDNKSELWINAQKAASLVLPENTGDWHKWTQATVGEIVFPVAGENLLTLKYNKGSNLAYLDFLLIEELPGIIDSAPNNSVKELPKK